MKRALKPVTIPLPKGVSPDIRKSVEKAEAAMRENNKLIEEMLASLEKTIATLSAVSESAGLEVVNGTQTAATGSWAGSTKAPTLYDGFRILYRLPYAGSGNASLNLTLATGVETGAKAVYRYGTTHLTTHYGAGALIPLTYLADTDAWYADADYSISTTYTGGYCTTGATTAAKAASFTYFALHANEWIPVNFRHANTKKAAITLNINGTGAKPLYIDGNPSSASNYAFPAGSYLIYYDGTNYYLRTDGKLPQATA